MLTEAIVINGMKMIAESPDVNVTDLVRSMNQITEGVIKSLSKKSRKVTGRRLRDVATISSNNDRDLGKLVADVYSMVGTDGVVTAENSQTSDTYYEVTNGIKIDRGHTSRLFINNQKNDECILDDVYILATDLEITNILNIENVLKPIINQNKKLLIIGDCSQNVINTLGMNVVKNSLKICNIKPPQFGYKTKELMGDIALSVGAKYFSEATGDDLSLITMEDLGHAQKVVVGPSQTVIIRDEKTSDEVDSRISELKQAREISKTKSDRDFINDRIASLSGGVGVIYVGGDSDIEQKELYDRVEDAVCAVRSALEDGILPGGGVALWRESMYIEPSDVAEHIVCEALRAPINQILSNAGLDLSNYDITMMINGNNGIDAKTGQVLDMYKAGIIDPAKVTKNALKNAMSVATTILTTNAIVTIKR